MDSEQTFLNADSHDVSSDDAMVSHVAQTLCRDAISYYGVTGARDSEGWLDARHAALHLMLNATPNQKVHHDIVEDFDLYYQKITSTMEHHATGLQSEHNYVEEYLHNVPDTVNPVRASLVYVQVPAKDGESTELHLVWKVRLSVKALTK